MALTLPKEPEPSDKAMPSYEETFREAVKDKAIGRHSEAYFRPVDMPDVLLESYRHNLAVLGLEGFDVVGNKVYSRLDLIADFSDVKRGEWDEYRQGLLDAALKWVAELEEPEESFDLPRVHRA